MQTQTIPYTRDLVLVGGGHTHALILKRWAMDPLPGARVTVINPDPTAAYSGMLPGHIAGHYTRDELEIDLVRLAQFAGARLVIARACGIDRAKRQVLIEGQAAIGYDVVSLDIGITSRMPDLPGFAEHATPAKPLGPFAEAWGRFRDSDSDGEGPARVVVLGGGVAGAELALAMAHGLRAVGRVPEVTIVERNSALTALGAGAARALRAALDAAGITLRETTEAIEVHSDRVTLSNGETIPAQFVTGATGALPYPWLARTGLANDAGFVPVDERLRSTDPAIFAVGDCADMVQSARPKAGVYAVRQAPFLLHNLRAALAQTGGMKPYRPQKDYLKLISL
ncbi:MAG: FAD-dependent oxidoreductase, partial [Roseovarius sp.]|nr:FAD-dependent oxidoreductase [Roseovarius sp.]